MGRAKGRCCPELSVHRLLMYLDVLHNVQSHTAERSDNAPRSQPRVHPMQLPARPAATHPWLSLPLPQFCPGQHITCHYAVPHLPEW